MFELLLLVSLWFVWVLASAACRRRPFPAVSRLSVVLSILMLSILRRFVHSSDVEKHCFVQSNTDSVLRV